MSRALMRLAFVAGPLALGRAAAAEPPSPSPPALEAACSRGDQAACTAFGYQIASQRAFPPDLPRAFDLWRRGCDAGHLPACVPYGEVLLTGYAPGDGQRYVASGRAAEAISPHRWKGERVLGRACQGGQPRACDILGLALVDKKRKHEDACRLFARACKAGDSGGCWDQVRSCHREVAVTVAKGRVPMDFRAAAFAVDRGGTLLVEGANGGPESRVARIDASGRLTWQGTVPAGLWTIADCADGRTAWFADGARLFRLEGTNAPRPVTLPAWETLAETSPAEIAVCLDDGSAVIARAVSAPITDDDYRQHGDRHPALLGDPEVATLQKLSLSVHPLTRPREVEEARALAGSLASDLRGGMTWADALQRAKEAWYWLDVTESTYSPSETPPVGAPPPGVFSLSAGQVLGPVEQLEPAPQGRLARQKGAFTLWRMVSHVPARPPAPAQVIARAKAELRARVVELLVVTPAGVVARQRLPVIAVSRIGEDGQLGPLVPLGQGSFALLGVNRRIWKAGQWTTDAPLLTALGEGPVLDAVRKDGRLAVLTDARVRVFDLAGHLQAEAGPSRIAAGAFYPRRIGVAGAEGFLLVSSNPPKVDVLALDDQLAFRWVDTLSVDNNDSFGRSAIFAPTGLWLLSAEGRLLTAYEPRHVVDYALAPTPP